MRYHSQNLNEFRNQVVGSMFWHGRAWFYLQPDRYRESLHVEWAFGKHARQFAITATFGYGDSDAGVCLHVCIPWLFSVYFVVPNVYRCHESQTGIGIHHNGFWLYPLADQHDSRHDHPWWKKTYCWHFPWDLNWHQTEILEHKANGLAKAIYTEQTSHNLGSKSFRRDYDARTKAASKVSETYDYAYTLKNGEVQHRKAIVHVIRMEWRARWYPLIWLKKVSTSIDINFSDEVGEETGSWKGGCIGCGYDMREGETPLQTLRRMEAERTF